MTFGMRKFKKKKPRKNWRVGRVKQRDKIQRSFGLVEKMFYYYEKIKEAVETARAEQGYYQSGSLKDGVGGGGKGAVSDPTARTAMKRIQPIRKIIIRADKLSDEIVFRPESWLKVVEQTFAYFGEKDLVTLVLRRRFLKNEQMFKTCLALEITEGKYYKLRDEGVTYARECAIQLGLIRVFEK